MILLFPGKGYLNFVVDGAFPTSVWVKEIGTEIIPAVILPRRPLP